jgi:hypothetical protein
MLFKTVAPLHDLHLGRDMSFQFAPNASLVRIPDWLKKDVSQLGQDEAECTHCFVYESEDNTPQYDPIYLANLALWLQPLSPVSFTFVFHAEESSGTFSVLMCERHDRFFYLPNDALNRGRIACEDLQPAQRLYAALSKIRRHSAPWTACRAVTMALQMQRNEIRNLLLWIALEALFGVENGAEIRYRLSQRLAFFIANDRTEASELFAKARRGYNIRCKVAHGGWGPQTQNTDEGVAITGCAEEFVRRSLIRLLQEDGTTEQFCGKNREAFLDGLPFLESVRQ